MAYTPINWQTGDTITAEKLNKMDNGWSVENTQLFSETVTTVDDGYGNYGSTLSYTGTDKPDSLTITFDGVDYNCAIQTKGSNNYYYGASSPTDFTAYPFLVGRIGGEWWLYTQTAGTYTISANSSVLETSDNFQRAVNNCVEIPEVPTFLSVGIWDGVTDKTWAEINSVISNGGICLLNGKIILTVWQGAEDRFYMAVADNDGEKFNPYIWRTAGDSADGTLSQYKRNSAIT